MQDCGIPNANALILHLLPSHDNISPSISKFWDRIKIRHALHYHKTEPTDTKVPKKYCGLVNPYGEISGSTLAQVKACSLVGPSNYFYQCWLLISDFHRLLSKSNLAYHTSTTIRQWNYSFYMLSCFNHYQIYSHFEFYLGFCMHKRLELLDKKSCLTRIS